MAFTLRVTKTVTEGNTTLSNTNTYTVETVKKLQEAVPDATTDQEHLLAIDVSALKAYSMQATVAMTVETNNGTTPQETFTLTANNPVIWEEGEAAIFAGDVTALYVTNSSGSAGQFNVLLGLDV